MYITPEEAIYMVKRWVFLGLLNYYIRISLCLLYIILIHDEVIFRAEYISVRLILN